jgi:hypothetical protein
MSIQVPNKQPGRAPLIREQEHMGQREGADTVGKECMQRLRNCVVIPSAD